MKEINARVRAKEIADRKEDESAQWSDRGYNPRATPVVTRSAKEPASARIGMLRTVESVQKSGWRIERAALNREARARGVSTAGHDQTGNPTAPHPPLASSQYPTNETDHRCPNCYGYHPDPGKGHKTVWYSCPVPWDETCWEKHNKREARLFRAGRTPEHKDHGARPDIAVLMTVLDLLPRDITENIKAAQEMISNRATDDGGSEPPLEELARCVEKIKLWVAEGAEAVTLIAANLRGRSSRISHAQSHNNQPRRRATATLRGQGTVFALADTFAQARSPRPTHLHERPLSAGAQRLVTEMMSPGVPQRPNTQSHTRATAAAEHCVTAGHGTHQQT